MRYFIAVCMVFGLGLVASAQHSLITYNAEDDLLTDILRDIETAHGIHFAYANDEMEGLRASIEARDVSLEKFLQTLLADLDLDFEIVSQHFISVKRADTIYISGRITDSATGDGLPCANVVREGYYSGVTTDVDGYFTMPVKAPFEGRIVVTYVGFDPVFIDVPAKSIKYLDLRAKPAIQELTAFTIREYFNRGVTTDGLAGTYRFNTQ